MTDNVNFYAQMISNQVSKEIKEGVERVQEADLSKIKTKDLEAITQLHKHYSKYFKNEKRGATHKDAAERGEIELKKRMQKEDVEAIDENVQAAKQIVKRYGNDVRKSHIMSHAKEVGLDPSKLSNAVSKLTGNPIKEEIEISEISHAKVNRYLDRSDEIADADRPGDDAKKPNRQRGSDLAYAKLTGNAKVPMTNIPKKAKAKVTMSNNKLTKEDFDNLLSSLDEEEFNNFALSLEEIINSSQG